MNWFKIGGVMVAIAAFALLLHVYGKARERAGHATATAEWQAKLSALEVQQGAQAARQQVAMAQAQVRAAESYAARAEAIEPVIVRSQTKVIEYAKTSEGAGPCLPAERVRAIGADRASLFAANPATASGGPAPLLPTGFADAD